MLYIYAIYDTNIIMNKNKYIAFKRLANSRVNKALNMIKLVSNLANKSHYEYSDQDVKKIVGALESEIRSLKSKFSNSKKDKKDIGFNLD